MVPRPRRSLASGQAHGAEFYFVPYLINTEALCDRKHYPCFYQKTEAALDVCTKNNDSSEHQERLTNRKEELITQNILIKISTASLYSASTHGLLDYSSVGFYYFSK